MARVIATVATCVLATLLAACGGDSNGPSSTVTAVTIAGPSSILGVGLTSQLTLIATTSSGATQAVTGAVQWQSSNPSVATVSPAGLVTAQGYGSTTITASYQGATTVFPLLVSLAGTWISAAADGSTLTWLLTQSQGIISGTFSFAPLSPGNSLSTATIGGTVSNSTFTWTMMATVGGDTSRPECVGTTPIISGTATLTSAGTSMNATIQAVNGICNPRLAAGLAVDAVLAFKKQ